MNSQPGTEWHYSISVDIQGYIVQKLSGMPFEEFLEKRIFKPLGDDRYRFLRAEGEVEPIRRIL